MKPFTHILTLLLFMLPVATLWAVEWQDLFDIETESESVEFYERILDYLDHPLDLNQCTTRELTELPWITQDMARAIIRFRVRKHGFARVNQIYQIPQVRPVVDLVQPLLTVTTITRNRYTQRSRALLGLQQSRAYREDKYLGDAYRHYHRVIVEHNNLALGLVAEKDPGEPSPFDYYAGYVSLHLFRQRTQVILGQFALQSGQGLVYGGPWQPKAGFDPVAPVLGYNSSARPFTSVDENYAMQGGAVNLDFDWCKVTGFFSQRSIDANIENDHIISLHSSGYHRYGSEWSCKDALKVSAQGINTSVMPVSHALLGANFINVQYEYPFAATDRAQQSVYGSLYGSCYLAGNRLFGEYARSEHGGAGMLGLVTGRPGLDMVVLWRQYDAHYTAPYAGAFGANDSPGNESGLYWGWKWQPNPQLKIVLHVDKYRHPVFVQSSRSALSGVQWYAGLEYGSADGLVLQCRIKYKQRETLVTGADSRGNAIKLAGWHDYANVRLQARYQAGRHVRITSRLEYNVSGWRFLDTNQPEPDSLGTLMHHDLRWEPVKALVLHTRWTLFDAPYYNLRFYAFENDLPGMMRLVMLQQRGARWYIMARYRLGRHVRITCKYEYIKYDNVDVIGSGYDMISGNFNNRIGFQLDFRI